MANRAGLGAVLEISTVSATFFSDFFRLLGWVWELFWGFLRFQLLFSGFFSAFGLILGAVLKVLWITAPQGPAYYAINLWLLYIMLI